MLGEMRRPIWLVVALVVPGVLTYVLVGRQHAEDVRRASFSLQVPAGWHIDTKEDDYDAERRFTVVGPLETTAHVLFYLYDHVLDPRERADFMAENIAKNHANALRASFSRWGRYDGEGREVRDPATSDTPTVARIFVHSEDGRSLMVVETFLDEHEKELRPVLQQLASSFRLASSPDGGQKQ
jgi:hypothetical protein